MRQVEHAFGAYGIEVLFQEDGLRRIAELAGAEKTGARGLMTVCERVFRELKIRAALHVGASVRGDAGAGERSEDGTGCFSGGAGEGTAGHVEGDRPRVRRSFSAVSQFATLSITDEAAEWLVDEAQRLSRPVRDLCAERFKDFQFGLRLIAQNSGQAEFIVDEATAKDPEKALSSWVVASYRGIGAEAGTESKT